MRLNTSDVFAAKGWLVKVGRLQTINICVETSVGWENKGKKLSFKLLTVYENRLAFFKSLRDAYLFFQIYNVDIRV